MYENKHIPPLTPAVPKWGNNLTKAMGRMLLGVYRWYIEGHLPDAPRFVIVLAPHTSSMDFFIGMGTMFAVGFKSSWFIADAYDWWPLGNVLRWLGAIPVDRTMRLDLVARMVEKFNRSDRFILAIFPEGSRQKIEQWKTGFWHIADGAGVPIQLVAMDYDKRATIFGPVIETSGDREKDMKAIRRHFRSVRGKHPDKFEADSI